MKMNQFACVSAAWAFGIAVAAALVLGGVPAAWGQDATEAGMQVLTRGPVHEAFAEASMAGATAGVVISKAPPDPITEVPPDQRPEGGNVAWIPGYWSWDDERSDFIWVSGVWRDIPPGRQWIPGYWTPVQGGSQWISGFWGEVAQSQVTYLPPPPEPLEAGPSSPAPSPDNLWTPGSWIWQDTRYDWQPGYWMPQQPDWVWVPAHYTWTPRGYVYVPGYWDHDIIHRGMMFAPVYYEHPVYARPSYSYSPSILIDLGVVAACLFIGPRSHHYYFGDYYDHRYEDRGFHPWYSKEARRFGDDPVYMHYRAQQLRQDPDWDNHIESQFRDRREHVDMRPPQTLALQVNIFKSRKADTPENMFIGRSFAEVAQSKTMPLRLAPVNVDERKQFETRGQEVRKFQVERAKLEMAPKPSGKSKGGREALRPVNVQLPVSPVAAKPTENVAGMKSPPPMPAAPKPHAVEGRGPQERPSKGETTAAPSQPREKPGKVEAKPSTVREKPSRVGPKPHEVTPVSTPQSTEAKPSTVREKPNRAWPKPAGVTPVSTPRSTEAKPVPGRGKPTRVESKPETVTPVPTRQNTEAVPSKDRERPTRVESKPETVRPESTPQNAAPQRKPAKRPAGSVRTDTNSPASRNVARPRPESVKPANEAPAPQAPKAEVRPQTTEPKAQQPRSNTRKQPTTRGQAPNTQDKKDNKDDVR